LIGQMMTGMKKNETENLVGKKENA